MPFESHHSIKLGNIRLPGGGKKGKEGGEGGKKKKEEKRGEKRKKERKKERKREGRDFYGPDLHHQCFLNVEVYQESQLKHYISIDIYME